MTIPSLIISLFLSSPVAAGETVTDTASPAADAPPEDANSEDAKWDISDVHGPTRVVPLDLTEGTWMSATVHGERVVFDLLGDLWSIPLAGGDATQLTSGPAWDVEPAFSPDGEWIAYVSDADGNEQLWKMRADGSDATVITHESEARVTDPVWDPLGEYVIGRRRTVDTRSIGVTELWRYHLDGGKGVRLTELAAHPHAGEATTSGRYIYFSSRQGRFNYDEDPVGGLWRVMRLDQQTGELRPIAHGAGSAARPVLTADGRQLLFISRDRTRTLLERLDLETGARAVVADWLDNDQLEGFALHGTYPRMSLAGDDAVVLWAEGKLWRVSIADGARTPVPFHAQGEWTVREVVRAPNSIEDTVRAKVLRAPAQHPTDGRLAFSAMGALWMRAADGVVTRVSPGTGYSPAWTPDGGALAWTSWVDCPVEGVDGECGGRLHITRGRKTETLPLRGQLVNPAWSEDGRELVVLRGFGGGTSPDLGAMPWFEIVHLRRDKRVWRSAVVGTISNPGAAMRAPHLRVHDGRVYFLDESPVTGREPSDSVLVSLDLDGHDRREHLLFDGAVEAIPSPDMTRVAFKQGHQVHITAMPPGPKRVDVSSGALPVRALTDVVGDWVRWSPDGASLSWMVGPDLHSVGVDTLASEDDDDIPESSVTAISLEVPRARPGGVIALTHATALTMDGDTVIDDATIVIERDRILSVSAGGAVPGGATVIDCTGKTVIPGLIDVHAHLHYTAGDVLPEQEWRYLTALDFGVTTVHDPSASTDLVFTQAERVAAGLSVGPRVYSTGFVLYGALSNIGATTPDEDAARHHVQRLGAVGARSVKVYQQSRRDERQWFIQACEEEGILCVAEGGGDIWMDINMAVDGMTAVEHALPRAPLYADVRGLLAGSQGVGGEGRGVAYSPTLLVAYGGLSGESWFFQKDNPLDDERLLRHHPRRQLDARAWRISMFAQDDDFHHQEVARDAARLADAGVLVTLGAHGQLQGLGVHWELQALAGPGAMTPMQALHAATIDGARYLGLEAELGSLSAGKLADLVILDADPRDDIRNSRAIYRVVQNGVVYE